MSIKRSTNARIAHSKNTMNDQGNNQEQDGIHSQNQSSLESGNLESDRSLQKGILVTNRFVDRFIHRFIIHRFTHQFWQAPTPTSKTRSWRQCLAPSGLSLLLGLTGGWMVSSAIVPKPVQAYTATLDVALEVVPGESFEVLLRRAEAIARAATQRSFDRDVLVTDVSIVVTAQREATVVPVLSVVTTRSQWQGRPDPREWATYYRTARGLLKLESAPTAATAIAPTVTIPAGAPQAAQPPKPAPRKPTAKSPAKSTANRRRPSARPTTRRSTPRRPATSAPAVTPTANPPAPAQPTPPAPILPDRIPTPGGIGK